MQGEMALAASWRKRKYNVIIKEGNNLNLSWHQYAMLAGIVRVCRLFACARGLRALGGWRRATWQSAQRAHHVIVSASVAGFLLAL